jgi:hypothetical protein
MPARHAAASEARVVFDSDVVRCKPTVNVADFPQLLRPRNSQITSRLLYRSSEARTGEKKEGAMRVRVAVDGRLLGLDTGDWSTLIAGSMLAGLLAFFM